MDAAGRRPFPSRQRVMDVMPAVVSAMRMTDLALNVLGFLARGVDGGHSHKIKDVYVFAYCPDRSSEIGPAFIPASHLVPCLVLATAYPSRITQYLDNACTCLGPLVVLFPLAARLPGLPMSSLRHSFYQLTVMLSYRHWPSRVNHWRVNFCQQLHRTRRYLLYLPTTSRAFSSHRASASDFIISKSPPLLSRNFAEDLFLDF
jgi:hypothetical protein